MSGRFKTVLVLLGIMMLFYLVAPYPLRGTRALTTKSRLVVLYPAAVQGRITGSYVNRQYHLYYLNGDTKQYYDFNAFGQPLTPAQAQLSQEEQHTLGLGQRLETGDIVSKAANSTTLLVQRGDSTSRWFCSTAQQEAQARQAVR
jgi:hypothetical protein